DVIERLHLIGGERQAHDVVFAVRILDPHGALEIGLAAGAGLLPGDPDRILGGAEETLQRRHDAIGALVLAIDRAPVLDRLLIGLAVIDDDKRRLSGGAHQTASLLRSDNRLKRSIASMIPPAPSRVAQ